MAWRRRLSPISRTDAEKRWLHDFQISEMFSGAPNHIHTNYEDLLADPEAVSLDLSAALGLRLDPRNLASPQALIAPHETWKKNNAIQKIISTNPPIDYEPPEFMTQMYEGFCNDLARTRR